MGSPEGVGNSEGWRVHRALASGGVQTGMRGEPRGAV